MKFREDGYEITIRHEFRVYEGRAIVIDEPGNPVKHDPVIVDLDITARPLAEVEITVGEVQSQEGSGVNQT